MEMFSRKPFSCASDYGRAWELLPTEGWLLCAMHTTGLFLRSAGHGLGFPSSDERVSLKQVATEPQFPCLACAFRLILSLQEASGQKFRSMIQAKWFKSLLSQVFFLPPTADEFPPLKILSGTEKTKTRETPPQVWWRWEWEADVALAKLCSSALSLECSNDGFPNLM